ncbi:hypothetical protein PEC18_28335 [Paucibacter sp. O1-1]|nr:hypothetical protein [Paucibacter sp. O1-1]MDA3829648.1 hypothetical protein [Paucibacter sp. O1-1]
MKLKLLTLALATPLMANAQAQFAKSDALQWGLVLDVGAASRELALGARPQGAHLGGLELGVAGNLGEHFAGRATLAAHSHSHDGKKKVESELEEAWIETRSLPAGLQLRGGRMLAQLGYLNEQHPHADDFSERPLLYRSFLGGHYFDNGLRLSWTAPTALYWRSGIELLSGRELNPDAGSEHNGARPSIAAWAANTKLGGDIGRSQSWQLGLSYLRNKAPGSGAHEHEHEEAHEEEEGHDHAHGARYQGRHLWIVDGVWKWSPGGNNGAQQLRLSGELAQVSRLNEFAGSGDKHRSAYLAAVWRFSPQWETGLRVDSLSLREPHGDHFHPAKLREQTLMLAWKPSHAQSLRLQYSRQDDRGGFDAAAKRSVQLQYIVSFGAHGAHSF